MRYIVTHNGKCFYTNWFSLGNNWSEGMVVVDLRKEQYMVDPQAGWLDIEYDHL